MARVEVVGNQLRVQMEECLGLAVDKGVKVVANAGGLNPAGLAAELRALAGRLGLTVSVAHVEGDDLLGRLDELKAAGEPLAHLDTGTGLAEAGVTPVTANAYLGAWGIVAALEAGADVVVSGRVTDASLVVGPAAWHFGWATDDVELARLMTQKAAWATDAGGPGAGEAANMAKYAAAEAAMHAVDVAIQIHGGNGFAAEYSIADLWWMARVLRTPPVSREMILNYVAEHSLRLPRSY